MLNASAAEAMRAYAEDDPQTMSGGFCCHVVRIAGRGFADLSVDEVVEQPASISPLGVIRPMTAFNQLTLVAPVQADSQFP